MEQREYRTETKSLGGQRSSAVALTVGAAKARTHSGKQSFYLVILKEGCLQAAQGKERLDFTVCVTFYSLSLATLSMSSWSGWGGGFSCGNPRHGVLHPASQLLTGLSGSLKLPLSSVRSGPGPGYRTLWWGLGEMYGQLVPGLGSKDTVWGLLRSILNGSSYPRCVPGIWLERWACCHFLWWARLASRMHKPTGSHGPSVSLPFRIHHPRPPPAFLVSLSTIPSLAQTPRTSVTLWPASCWCSYSPPFLPLRYSREYSFWNADLVLSLSCLEGFLLIWG